MNTGAKDNRPMTSIFFRPVRRPQPTKQTDIDFYVGVPEFGSDAPKVRIGTSRLETRPRHSTPAPGYYNPISPISKKLPHKITSSHDWPKSTMNTNIDYINHTTFPNKKPATIGIRDGTTFFHMTNGPPCRYYPGISFDKPKVVISEKFPEPKENGIPGPGAYNPDFGLKKPPAFPLMGPKYRSDWMVDPHNSPSPVQYNPTKQTKQMPFWSIGNKSRSKKRWKRVTPFAIDQFVVKLDESITVKDARAYVDAHDELKQIIRELFDLVYREKSETPLELIRDYFQREKDEILEAQDPLEKLLIRFRSKQP